MLKSDIRRILKIEKEMRVINNFLDVDYVLFLFGFKPAVLIFLTEKNNKEFDLVVDLYICFTEKCTRRKVYANDFYDDRGLKDSFILSYNKLKKRDLIINKKLNHKKLGGILGYPECCIKKFIEDYIEERRVSICWDSAKRYLNQLKEMNIKDPFEVKISKNGILIDSKIGGFIPCSPKCEKALSMIENYELINKIINQNAKI